jgi:serine/threonine protein kinase
MVFLFHKVRLAKDRNTDNLYAVKVIQRSLKQHKFGSKNSGANQTEEEVKREIAIMKKLNHPHVLRLYEVMDDPKVNKLYLVLEYMKGGDMMQLQEGDPKTYSCKPMADNLLLRVLSQVKFPFLLLYIVCVCILSFSCTVFMK